MKRFKLPPFVLVICALLVFGYAYACSSEKPVPVAPDTSQLDKDGGRLPLPADDPPPCCSDTALLGCNPRC
jgi:hypothetical protein